MEYKTILKKLGEPDPIKLIKRLTLKVLDFVKELIDIR